MAEFKETKQLRSLNIDANLESYSLDGERIQFEKCREKFAKIFTPHITGFFFKHERGESEPIADFLAKTETILNLKELTQFALTNDPTIIWVEPAPFWRSCEMRRSFLTCLVRAGRVYRGNYEHSLYSQQYLYPTKLAVMRFMFGFTKYVGPPLEQPNSVSTLITAGWYSMFANKDEQTIRSMLVWPEDTFYRPTAPIGESLWF